MSGKWNNSEAGQSADDKFGALFKDEYAVILLQGKNSFGDMIFSYVKVGLPKIKLLYAALNSGEDFAPSDFGEIIAAGKGLPSEEIKAEIASNYKSLQSITPATFSPAQAAPKPVITEKKAWDEY